MRSQEEHSRFDMTPPPEPGGHIGGYVEKLAQWLLEHTFFRDFVYRAPLGKGRKGELADALVLFDDTMLMVQVKAQVSGRDPKDWARKHLARALKQLSYTHRMLEDGHVTEVMDLELGTERFDSAAFRHRHGLIVVDQSWIEPYAPESVVPGLLHQPFPVHVLTLADFREVSSRFDTAGDFIVYLEMRYGAAEKLLHAEESVAQSVASSIEDLLHDHDPSLPPEALAKSCEIFRSKVTGVIRDTDEWKYGLLIDDVIAHLRDIDPALAWATPSHRAGVKSVASRLAWLTRERRIEDGRKLFEMVEKGETDWHYRVMRRLKRAYVYLVYKGERGPGVRFLQVLAYSARGHFGVDEVIGMITNPLIPSKPGRAYDVVLVDAPPPAAIAEILESGPSLFD